MVDAFAARNLRIGQPKHHCLQEFKIVLLRRAFGYLQKVKHRPGGEYTLAEWLESNKYIEEVVSRPPWIPDDDVEDMQRFISSGHLAFYWACKRWPGSEVHLFGFDSLFIGTETISHTREELSGDDISNREVREAPTVCVKTWAEYWDVLFNEEDFQKAIFWGYEGVGEFLPAEGPRVSHQRVEAYKDET